jgi:hypothetical protein
MDEAKQFVYQKPIDLISIMIQWEKPNERSSKTYFDDCAPAL